MNIEVEHGLPFVQLRICFRGQVLQLDKILLDTGSAGTILNANRLESIGVIPEGNDVVDAIRGIGNMEYGLEINGIVGFDFISAANLVIDTATMCVYPRNHN